jgi:hypothetical protein
MKEYLKLRLGLWGFAVVAAPIAAAAVQGRGASPIGILVFGALPYAAYLLFIRSFMGSLLLGIALAAVSISTEIYVASNSTHSTAALGYLWIYLAAPPLLLLALVSEFLVKRIDRWDRPASSKGPGPAG